MGVPMEGFFDGAEAVLATPAPPAAHKAPAKTLTPSAEPVPRKGTAGTEETRAVGTAEIGTEGAAGIGATGAAGAVIPTPAAISGPSEVSASGEISMQMKRKYRKKIKGKEDTYP